MRRNWRVRSAAVSHCARVYVVNLPIGMLRYAEKKAESLNQVISSLALIFPGAFGSFQLQRA